MKRRRAGRRRCCRPSWARTRRQSCSAGSVPPTRPTTATLHGRCLTAHGCRPTSEARIDRDRDAADRGHPRRAQRRRRRRGDAARIRALHQGRPRADGAGRGAAARAGCSDGRPVHRGQARTGRLRPSPDEIERAGGQRLGLGARPVGGRDPARRDAAGHDRPADQADRPAGGADRNAAGDAADGQPLRAGRDDRRRARACAIRRSRMPSATRSTCSAKARARRRMQRAISTPMRTRSTRSAAPPATGRCPTVPASPSSSRRCIRATRRSAGRA